MYALEIEQNLLIFLMTHVSYILENSIPKITIVSSSNADTINRRPVKEITDGMDTAAEGSGYETAETVHEETRFHLDVFVEGAGYDDSKGFEHHGSSGKDLCSCFGYVHDVKRQNIGG